MTTVNKRPSTKRQTSPIAKWFQNWLEVRDEGEVLKARQADLRDRLVEVVAERGDEDDKGNAWFDLAEPITFTDWKGKTHQYTTLKRERHLTPAQPQPDPEAAEELLRTKDMWLTEKQLKAIRDIQLACPYAVITVDVDVDAVAAAWFKDIISEEEYASVLTPQRETFQFRPSES